MSDSTTQSTKKGRGRPPLERKRDDPEFWEREEKKREKVSKYQKEYYEQRKKNKAQQKKSAYKELEKAIELAAEHGFKISDNAREYLTKLKPKDANEDNEQHENEQHSDSISGE